MRVLLTYAQARVPQSLQRALAQADQVCYCPLRQLVASELTPAAQAQLQQATHLAFTSHFGLLAFIKRWAALNTTATLHVLSPKLAALAQPLANPVMVAAGETQAALVAGLSDAQRQQVLWLTGNRLAHPERPLPGQRLVIYHNRFNLDDQAKAATQLTGQHFDRVLVTSPSNFEALQQTISNMGRNPVAGAVYYVLGHTTATRVIQAGFPVVIPQTPHDVLAQMIHQLLMP